MSSTSILEQGIQLSPAWHSGKIEGSNTLDTSFVTHVTCTKMLSQAETNEQNELNQSTPVLVAIKLTEITQLLCNKHTGQHEA